ICVENTTGVESIRAVVLQAHELAGTSGSVDRDHQADVRLFRASGVRRRGTSAAWGSEPRSFRSFSYVACRVNASRPCRTVSVSVAAPQPFFASRSVASSMWSVFFIPLKLSSLYSKSGHTVLQTLTLDSISKLVIVAL